MAKKLASLVTGLSRVHTGSAPQRNARQCDAVRCLACCKRMLPSNRQHLICVNCLEVRRENNLNCFTTVVHNDTHILVNNSYICMLVWFIDLLLCTCFGLAFCTEDKASGVKFGTVVQRRPWQVISNLGELCSPRSHKSDE